MNGYLAQWFAELPALHRETIQTVIQVTGHCERPFGPKGDYARLHMSIEPATQFEISASAPEIKFRVKEQTKYSPDDFVIEKKELARFLDQAVFGLLDVMMPNEHGPKLEFGIVIEEIEYCPIDSSEMAFRIAGRDAGQKIIEVWKDSRRAPHIYRRTLPGDVG
jgi:hypothetical protein